MSKADELKKEAEDYAEQCYGWTNNDLALDVAIASYIVSAESREKRIEELERQIEKMKCCGNCKYGYCGGSSISIDENGNRTFHNWNEEKQEYCDVGKNGKYQCWELAE